MSTSSDQSYGEWLREQRESKGWTQVALAERSGVSNVQISNIESGRSSNPQAATRQKLENALEVSPSQKVLDEAKIEDWGVLQEFDPHDRSTWPQCPGIYVLYDADGRPAYVGRSTKQYISDRIEKHYDQK